ncbi:MAG: DUF3237 family protein [Oscillospiraceae bacterium]|nr:DUF3237 family protein [Oscillospiraceae bacterium]
MKKVLIIICVIVLMAASFAAGWFIPSEKGAEALNPGTPNASEKNEEADTPSNSEDTVLKNVFFSPKTGNDETGNGSKEAPFATLGKAKEHGETLTLNEGEKVVYLEFLMSIDIKTSAAAGVSSSKGTINMIPFTGSTDGAYFKGEIVGTGYDTQKFGVAGSPAFSARYLLKGKDYAGQSCSIFIENNGNELDKCTPTIITDSAVLSDWQNYNLRAIVTPVGYGVIVDTYRIHE